MARGLQSIMATCGLQASIRISILIFTTMLKSGARDNFGTGSEYGLSRSV